MKHGKKLNAIVLAMLLSIVASITALADEYTKEPEPLKVTLTCYLPTGHKTYTGEEPHNGIIAGKKEWIGMTAAIYKRNADGTQGDFIGFYEVKDTGEGKNGAIRKGYVIDVFCETEEDIIPTQKVFMYLYEGKG